MEKFFEDLLDEFLSPEFLDVVRKKYHYSEDQLSELENVASKLMPHVRRDACWNHRFFYNYAEVVMTLGEGPDILQEEFAGQGLLSECYMVESLASELLLRGYAAYNRYVAEHTNYHVARYHFLGSGQKFPLDRLGGMLKRLQLPVRCNAAFCMMPKKSVAFVAELTKDETSRCQGICVGCNSGNCPNRMEDGLHLGRMIADMTDVPLSYGYSRIFGRI